MNLIILGAPGSGKSTQAKLLADELCLPCLEAGNLFYLLSQENSKKGQAIKKAMTEGFLVADDLAVAAVGEQLTSPSYQKGVIIDGFPRSLGQAQKFKWTPDKVLYIDVSDEENTQRLFKRGRHDDKPEMIKKRLAVYHQETEPVLDFYSQKGLLIKVDGERPVGVIHEDIVKRLKK